MDVKGKLFLSYRCARWGMGLCMCSCSRNKEVGGRLQWFAHECVCPICVCDTALNTQIYRLPRQLQLSPRASPWLSAPLWTLHYLITLNVGKKPWIIHILWGSAKHLQDGNASRYKSQGSPAAKQGSHEWWSARCTRRGGFWQPHFKHILHDSNNKWINMNE